MPLDLAVVERGAGRYSGAADQFDLGLVLEADPRIHGRIALIADQVWMPSAAIGPGA